MAHCKAPLPLSKTCQGALDATLQDHGSLPSRNFHFVGQLHIARRSKYPLRSTLPSEEWKRRVDSKVRCAGSDGSGSGADYRGSSEPSIANHTFDRIGHLTDFLPDLQESPNPLKLNPAFSDVEDFFMGPSHAVAKQVFLDAETPRDGTAFLRAGPRETIFFEPESVRAAIVTCGGLCPGLNTVIRELVFALWFQYGVRDILGISGGYRGFYATNTVPLTPKEVEHIHKRGGTILGTSRGGHDTTKIVDSLQDRGINQVYIIGGDGTQRGAVKIHEEVVRRGLKIAVAGIPKTIDNDVAIIDKSFGFDTAVEAAQAAIDAAHVEAESAPQGVGLVKLMGRFAGHIAMVATLASRDVDCCLIPEVPFYLDGPGGLMEFLEKRIHDNGHCVIVVAEGAGQDLIAEHVDSTDASGNRMLKDVGLWLGAQLKDRYKAKHAQAVSLKYIDPTYMIRAIPSNASDNIYCTLLAHSAVHGAMAGYTGFISGPVNGKYCYIPMERVTDTNNMVNVNDKVWAWTRSMNNQPDFSKPPPKEAPPQPTLRKRREKQREMVTLEGGGV